MRGLFKIFLSLFIIFAYPGKIHANHNPESSIKYFAKEGSLGIETPVSSGSGFIIGKKKNKYFFITANHVAVSDPQKEEYWVYSVSNGNSRKYKVNSFIKPKEMEGKDIILGSFISEENLLIMPIIALGDIRLVAEAGSDLVKKEPNMGDYYQGFSNSYNTFQRGWIHNSVGYNFELEIQGQPIIAGVSIPTEAISVPLFRTSLAYFQGNAVGNQNGYETIYSTLSTVPGMSGGGLFGARMCPKYKYDINDEVTLNKLTLRENKEYKQISSGTKISGDYYYVGVLAMHGMSEEYLESGSRSGTGLGIPLSLFSEFFKKNASEFGIPIGKEYFKIVYQYCSS